MEKRRRKIKIVAILGIVIALLVSTYYWACYTNNPFVSKWRTIYIETAMSTMTHQWLATKLLPENVVRPVMEASVLQLEDNIIDESKDIPIKYESSFEKLSKESNTNSEIDEQSLEKRQFGKIYSFIDMETIPDTDDWYNIQLEDCTDLGIKTTCGDSVWALDTVNGITIVDIEGDGYKGKLAIVNNPEQVRLQKSNLYGCGQTVTKLVEDAGGLVGINASGFFDAEGKGNGGTPVGLVISDSVTVNEAMNTGNYQTAGFNRDDTFKVGSKLDNETLRDAVQFYPILVLNGDKYARGSYGLGLQPRTAIGQTWDKKVLLLVIDGRQVGHSIGATMEDCADILLRYNAFTAMNMDGGSSSSMTYKDKMITKTSSPASGGRYVPDCWMVMPAMNNG